MSRIRIKYKRQEEIRYIGHLDMMRMWHRALRRANVPLAYSEGFNPHPKMVFAAPLALGVLSESEFLDIYLTQPLSAITIKQKLAHALPKGIEISQIMIVPDELPNMPSIISKAEFVVVANKPTSYDPTNRIHTILESDNISWQQERDGSIRIYNIRQMIFDISIERMESNKIEIKMLLRCDNTGSGRPEQVMKLLELEDILVITRTKLIMGQ